MVPIVGGREGKKRKTGESRYLEKKRAILD